jgi:hypothetical protein
MPGSAVVELVPSRSTAHAADRPAEDDGRHAHLHRWLASDLYGHTPVVRIATWNLNVKMRPGALDLFDKLDADVLLLTEAPADLDLDGYVRTPPGPQMLRGQGWATILSRRPIQQVKRPHGASVAAVIDGITYVSSLLPWGSSPPGPPFRGVGQAAQTVAALKDLKAWLGAQERLVWGGDWNHSLERPWRYSGSTAGRERLDALLGELGLHAPTRHLPRGWQYDFPSIDMWPCSTPTRPPSTSRRTAPQAGSATTTHTSSRPQRASGAQARRAGEGSGVECPVPPMLRAGAPFAPRWGALPRRATRRPAGCLRGVVRRGRAWRSTARG